MTQKRADRTLGGAHTTFWEWCGRDELRLQKCESCGEHQWPAVKACTHCGGETFAWDRMSGRGTVVSWSTFEKDYYRGLMPMPYDTILVALEEGPLFISNPRGFGREDLEPDMPVVVSFVDAQDSNGAFRLPLFEKA